MPIGKETHKPALKQMRHFYSVNYLAVLGLNVLIHKNGLHYKKIVRSL